MLEAIFTLRFIPLHARFFLFEACFCSFSGFRF
ncbi:Uncharacterised protein [Vibrio cholerae]|nr:Uncharacterised protein [Vibrio cholerae]